MISATQDSDLSVINLDGVSRSEVVRLVFEAMLEAGMPGEKIDGFLATVKQADYATTVTQAIAWGAPVRFMKQGRPWEEREAQVKAYNQRPRGSRMLKFLVYPARLIINLFYVAVVIFILAKTHEKDPNLTVSVGTLGLVYTAIRGLMINQSHAIFPLLFNVTKSIDELKDSHGLERTAIDGEYFPFDETSFGSFQVASLIDRFFLGVIRLICLFAIFIALF